MGQSIPDVKNTTKGEIVVANHSYPVWFVEENSSNYILNADNEAVMNELLALTVEEGLFKRNMWTQEIINLPITQSGDSSYSAFKYVIRVSKKK